MGDFRNAQGIVPWKEGDELPEDAIARARGHLPAWEKEVTRLRAENERLREVAKCAKELIDLLDKLDFDYTRAAYEKTTFAIQALERSE